MDFTWQHIFLLAERMLSLDITAITKKLDVSASTIYRHKRKTDSSRFRIKVDVYNCLFAPSEYTTETPEDRLVKLKRTLNDDCFPSTVRDLQFDDYESYIRHLVKLAEASDERKELKQRPKQDTPTAEALVDSSSTGAPTQRVKVASTETSVEGSPQTGAKTAQTDDTVLSPQVLDKWKKLLAPAEVIMSDEFINSYEKYSIGDFIKLNPIYLIGDSLYLMLENKMHEELLPTNGEQLVKNAASFVEHMEEALSRVEITEADSHSCKDIGTYVKVLRSYIGFILDIVPDPASSFQLSLFMVRGSKEDSKSLDFDDDNSDFQSDYETYHKLLSEFECKATEYRTKLQALYDEIIAQAHCMDQFKMYSYFY